MIFILVLYSQVFSHRFLFATDIVAGARFYSAGQLSTRRGLFVYTSPVTLHHIPPQISSASLEEWETFEDADECNVSLIRFY